SLLVWKQSFPLILVKTGGIGQLGTSSGMEEWAGGYSHLFWASCWQGMGETCLQFWAGKIIEKIKKMNEINIKAMQTQINNVKNELRNEMKTSIQASMSNQTNELKNMMASFFQMNTASTSGSGPHPSNTIANLKGELKAITTRSGLVLVGPSVPMPHPFINPKEDERVEETLTDPNLAKYTIKVPPPWKRILKKKDKNKAQNNKTKHEKEKIEKDKVI
nr:hypothetical protein [Tanacetum cinerariifolium]